MDNSDYTLLVVDDEDGVRQSLSAYLEDSGFNVLDAADADAGFALFEKHLPDLVITDLSMPGTDGLTLLQKIHNLIASVPVIVISGAGVMGDVVQALRLGATDYLIKPIVDMEVLELSIERSLERGQLLVDNQRYRVELERANKDLTEHVAVLEQDQKAGYYIQQTMLPVSPFYADSYVSEYSVIPALYLSGDCLDYAFIKQRYYAFYLADVSGHGSAPAFVTIWLKNLVAQLVRLKQHLVSFESESQALKQLLDVINAELLDLNVNNHLTMIIGILDTETHNLCYVVAGHLPLPILYEEGQARFLEGNGLPIGLYEEAEWTVNEVQLPQGLSSLLLFSDGILELMPSKSLQDKSNDLKSLVESSEADINRMIKQLGIEPEKELPDDMAVLSIRKVS